MSKVKYPGAYEFSTHDRTKARHALRRKETFKTKNNRIKEADYYYGGYYVKDFRYECKIKKVFVPERIYTPNKIRITKDKGIEFIQQEPVIIPAHYEKRRYSISKRDIKPYLKRASIGCKKYHKRVSNKKVRRSTSTYSRGKYKHLYDVAWNIY